MQENQFLWKYQINQLHILKPVDIKEIFQLISYISRQIIYLMKIMMKMIILVKEFHLFYIIQQ